MYKYQPDVGITHASFFMCFTLNSKCTMTVWTQPKEKKSHEPALEELWHRPEVA